MVNSRVTGWSNVKCHHSTEFGYLTTDGTLQPIPLRLSKEDEEIQILVQFYQARITAYDFFLYSDYGMGKLVSISTLPESYVNAILAFSALIADRNSCFSYYEKALQLHRFFIAKDNMSLEDRQFAIATCLFLSAWEV